MNKGVVAAIVIVVLVVIGVVWWKASGRAGTIEIREEDAPAEAQRQQEQAMNNLSPDVKAMIEQNRRQPPR